MKRILFAALLLAASGAQAEGLFEADDATTWRIGIGAEFGDYDGDDFKGGGGQNIDDSEVGFAMFSQYQFNKWWGIEGGYLNTGDFKDRIDNGANSRNIELSYRGFSIAAVGYAPIGGDDISLFGKVGFFDFDTDLSQDDSITDSGHQDGAMGGVGAIINIADNIGIRAEAQVYNVDDADFWTAIIGMEYQFGGSKK